MLHDEFFLGTKLYHKELINLSKPLEQYLGITHSIFFYIDKQHRAFCVCSHPNWVERFIQEEYYKLDLLMVHPDNIHNGFGFDIASEEQEFKDKLLYDAVINFNWCHSFAYIEKMPSGGYFGFDFGTSKDNHMLINKLLNETYIIKKLIKELQKKLFMKINNSIIENCMDFASFKVAEFTTQQGLVFNSQPDNKDKVKLLQQIGILSEHQAHFFNNVKLSPQETNCLRSYSLHKNIKKISQQLHLATSTVTDYIENIKNKLDCNTKNELFEKAEILQCLGHI
jgi:DNA-binding CsgD family transcriptional regulator